MTFPNQWLAIDSAPRDGQVILVNDQDPPVVAAKWTEGDGYALWIYADQILQDVAPEGPQCTHWMPLPPPPTPSAESGDGKA